MKPYLCPCGNMLYFDNSRCLECQREVGYDSTGDRMVEIGNEFARCANGVTHQNCNWVVPVAEQGKLCPACVLTTIIPDLTVPQNLPLWSMMEQAKRHAIYSLLRLELPLVDRIKDPKAGLAFQFLSPTPEKGVITGHEKGVITMNLEEADDAIRERNRTQLREPYRTLLGHFRHELGHYYWYTWFEAAPAQPGWLEACRQVFGDEQADYAAAMKTHYEQGAPAGWDNSFISAYSTMHPYEDWAETWAHYLHICDSLETAKDFGLEQGVKRKSIDLYTPVDADLPAPLDNSDTAEFLTLLHRWVRLSPALNAIAQSLGQRYLYPFVLSKPVVRKLHFIHACIDTLPSMERPEEPKTAAAPQRHAWLRSLFGLKAA